MFYALPAETVFEAKQRTRRATFYLFILLTFFYVLFADLLTAAAFLSLRFWIRISWLQDLQELLIYSTVGAVALAMVHFAVARRKSLDDLLGQMGAKPADPEDSYHAQFIDLVQEAEAASGLDGIRAVVIPNPGCNAFSLQDGRGQAAIGATEGILSKRSEERRVGKEC